MMMKDMVFIYWEDEWNEDEKEKREKTKSRNPDVPRVARCTSSTGTGEK